jgi:hypothetical protein
MLVNDTPFNKSNVVNISGCDRGKLIFDVKNPQSPPDPKALLVSKT